MEASKAVMRIQDAYGLDPEQIANGRLGDFVQVENNLTGNFFFGTLQFFKPRISNKHCSVTR